MVTSSVTCSPLTLAWSGHFTLHSRAVKSRTPDSSKGGALTPGGPPFRSPATLRPARRCFHAGSRNRRTGGPHVGHHDRHLGGLVKVDQVAGIALVAIGLVVFWECRGLPLGTLRSPGPAFMPVTLGVILGALGALIALTGGASPGL